jgi:NTP pyrophosphatase (non-canonical NTP hydrolase)
MTDNQKQRTLDDLEMLVALWAKDKGLIRKENSSRQMLKVMEEVGELAGSLAKNNHEATVDAIGDVLVTIIILSYQLGLSPEECLQSAYDEIKARTGKTVNGVFIKDK